MIFDNYIAIDWAQANIAIARSSGLSTKISVSEYPADLELVKRYLKNLTGTTILTFEETTTSQWLYVELNEYVDKLVVCDAHYNHLLLRGPKNDKIDATKLVKHLKNDTINEVYHSGHKFMELRKLVSAYEDIIAEGVRVRNQRAALFRAKGMSKKSTEFSDEVNQFILGIIDRNIAIYEENKACYRKLFEHIVKTERILSNLLSIPGIGVISAVKIGAAVIEAHRFPTNHHFWSYCGLVMHMKHSGKKSYGKRRPKCNKSLKSVFKSAVISTIGKGKSNKFRDYYEYLIREKNYAPYNARHAVARKIATVTYAVMKSEKPYTPCCLR